MMQRGPTQFMAPTRFANCHFWGDVHMGDTTGTLVDFSGNGRDYTASIGEIPTLSSTAAGKNGNKVFVFDGGDWMNIASATWGDFKRDDAFLFVFVALSDLADGVETLWSKYVSPKGIIARLRGDVVNDPWEWLLAFSGAARIWVRFPTGVSSGVWQLVEMGYTGSETAAGCSCVVNGTAISGGTLQDDLNNSIVATVDPEIGARSDDDSAAWDGNLALLVVYKVTSASGTAALNAAQVQRLRYWAACRFGFTV